MVRGRPKEIMPQTFKLDAALVERLNRYSETTGVTKTFAVEKAIEAYLDDKMPEERPGA